jgi:hypothetical protein
MVEQSSSNQIKNIRDNDEDCSTMDASMTISGDVSNAGKTAFVSEACEAVDALGDYMPMALSVPQPDIQDITQYFARPRLITRGSVTFGSTTPLYTVDYQADNSQLIAQFPQWTQRLAGAYGIRFSLNFRVQVAATAFHQGVLALSWQYGETGGKVFERGARPFTCTNLPHVRLDMSESTMAELKVPFLAPNEFWEVLGQTAGDPVAGDYGSLNLVPILPTVSVLGLAAATYDIYVYITDIELFGVDVINPSTIVLQGGGALIAKEVKEAKIVSGTLSNMAKISNFVARGIPSLAAIAGPASWALDTAAGVAKYFGFAKPIIQDPAIKHYRTAYVGEYHVDEPVCGEVVGPFQGNTTVIDTSLGATEIDEMALAYITSQWSQVYRGSVNTVNSHGTAVYAAPVSPSVFWFRTGGTSIGNINFPTSSASLISQSGNGFMPSSLMYISSFFRYWKGGMKFRFTFAKTKLHGGRYMVTYNPFLQFQAEPANFGAFAAGPEVVGTYQQPYGNSLIMDLKDSNIFEFTVPYVSTTPYRSFNSSIGSITVVCIDPLQATATVTNTVPFIVEVCGDSDYELADYSGVYFPLHQSATVYTQSGGELVAKTLKQTYSNTMGDRMMSAKQIIQMPSPTVLAVTTGYSVPQYVAPWFVNTTHISVTGMSAVPNAVNTTTGFQGGNNAGMAMARCYAFVKGGTDLHVYSTDNSAITTIHQGSILRARVRIRS